MPRRRVHEAGERGGGRQQQQQRRRRQLEHSLHPGSEATSVWALFREMHRSLAACGPVDAVSAAAMLGSLADMGFDRKAAERSVKALDKVVEAGPEKERELFRRALLELSAGG